jgi:Mechanosensitive ion channel, conserved TM helix
MRDDFVLILTSLRDTWYQIAAFLPRVLVALVLLIVGWLLARGLRWLGERLLRLLRVDLAAERTGVDDFLLRGGVRFTVVTLTGQFIYWVVLLIFVIAMFSVLGLSIGPDLVARLTGYVPSVVAALAILVFGSLIARFVRGLVEAYLNNFGVKASARIAMLVHGTLLAFVAILALEQVGIAVDLLTSAFKLAFGGLCLGLALAFGLGGRSWAESILERTRSKR